MAALDWEETDQACEIALMDFLAGFACEVVFDALVGLVAGAADVAMAGVDSAVWVWVTAGTEWLILALSRMETLKRRS